MRRFSLLMLCASLCIPFASAQSPASPATPQMNITLGHSAVAVDGPWRFHIGDNPRWADPGFNDSSWDSTSLETKEGSYDPGQGTPGFVPGWTGKGHPGYSGFAWYRIRVHLTGADAPLTLLAPSDVDDSYQIFVNGRLLGSFGDFSSSLPTIYRTQPFKFQIPSSLLRNSPGGNLEIAFRFYMAPRELLQNNSPGGMHDPPYIGLTDAIVPVYHVQWENQFQETASIIFNFLIYLLFTLLILMLYVFDRTERILLLPLAACAFSGINMLVTVFGNMSTLFTAILEVYAAAVLISLFRALWAITWWMYFGLQQKKWIRNAIIVVAALDTAVELLFPFLTTSGPRAPHFIFTAYSVSGYLTDAAVVVLLILIVYFGIRQAQKIDWMLLLALIFYGLPNLNPVYNALHIRTAWFPFGLDLNLAPLASLASLFCFSVVLMRRFRISQRRHQAVLEDVKQAQEVQQVLIPKTLPQVPGLTIESEYRPAREVGGDFFHIQPGKDGSLLIVSGDVSGKGLKAAMTVSTIVGALRNEPSRQPATVLDNLNRILYGNIDGFAVCTAALIRTDGSMSIANAGNLAPYLNGNEIPVASSLPLGVTLESTYIETAHQLNPGDRLTFISDGVVEATNPKRELFGFDRTQAISNQPASAIADTAQSFGQQDDISVIAITREPELKAAFA
ncbi:MAG TPA: SpoIIE family protein phosphatase [Acidobacteriaceae bacterium]|nr:SpoIIE family protein phosphatase [Acidobacteriaceae bacterium]